VVDRFKHEAKHFNGQSYSSFNSHNFNSVSESATTYSALPNQNLVDNEDWASVQNGMLQVFQDYIMAYINDCNIQPKQWPPLYGYEAIRIKRYLNNDYDRFDPHVDVLNTETSRRFLSFFIYLNDVDEGGETEFININKPGTYIPLKIKPRRGQLLMFPPLWMYYHAGLKPVSNSKYLINSYCHYD